MCIRDSTHTHMHAHILTKARTTATTTTHPRNQHYKLPDSPLTCPWSSISLNNPFPVPHEKMSQMSSLLAVAMDLAPLAHNCQHHKIIVHLVNIQTHASPQTHAHTQTHEHTRTHAHTHAHTHRHRHKHTHTHTHTHTHMHAHILTNARTTATTTPHPRNQHY